VVQARARARVEGRAALVARERDDDTPAAASDRAALAKKRSRSRRLSSIFGRRPATTT